MSTTRFDRMDALRAVAMLWMTAFHFSYDLNLYGYWKQSFLTDPFWTVQRTCIVSLFMFCAGLGQAVATDQGQSWPRFWKRWAQVAGAAALVTAGSAVMFPHTFIYFGVLHGIAVMLLIVRLTAHWDSKWLALIGAMAIGSKFLAATYLSGEAELASLFNARGLNWLGWITKKPITEDYVPLVPWIGVVWWGVAAGKWALAHRPQFLQGAFVGGPARGLARLGRYSLSYYLLHQPVLIGALIAFGWLRT